MKITGHKTEAIHARYAIAPRASLTAALRKQSEPREEQLTPRSNARKK